MLTNGKINARSMLKGFDRHGLTTMDNNDLEYYELFAFLLKHSVTYSLVYISRLFKRDFKDCRGPTINRTVRLMKERERVSPRSTLNIYSGPCFKYAGRSLQCQSEISRLWSREIFQEESVRSRRCHISLPFLAFLCPHKLPQKSLILSRVLSEGAEE